MSLQKVINEITVATQLIDGTYKGRPLSEHKSIFIIAKYLIHVDKKKEYEAVDSIHSFLAKNKKSYIWEKKDSYIRKLVRTASKSKIIEINEVVIYRDEINKIRTLNNLIKEKVLFSFLIYAKVKNKTSPNSNGWISDDSKDIFKDANVNYSLKKRSIVINELVKLGLVELKRTIDDNSRRITFMRNNGEVYCVVNDIREFGLTYEHLMGISDIMVCSECGRKVRKKNNKTRYCESCARDVKLENDRRLAQERYNSRK